MVEDIYKMNSSSYIDLDDNLIRNLTKILDYRKQISIKLRTCNNLSEQQLLIEKYNFSDETIKKLLNLWKNVKFVEQKQILVSI